MSIIKLQKGQSVHFTVTGVVPDVPATNPKYGPSTKFVGRTPTDPDAAIFLTPSSAERQLGRIGHTIESVVGHTVEFAKPGEYVDINAIEGAPTHAAPAVVAAPQGPAPVAPKASNAKQPFTSGPPIAGLDDDAAPTETGGDGKADLWRRLRVLHKKCLGFVLAEEAPLLTKADIGDSPEAVSALAGELFWAAVESGLHR